MSICPRCGNQIQAWAHGVCYTCRRMEGEHHRFGRRRPQRRYTESNLASSNSSKKFVLRQTESSLASDLPDLSLAADSPYNQRLKRVLKLSENPTPTKIAELTIYLTAPEDALRWLAGASLSMIGGPHVETALAALLELEIDYDARQCAEKIYDQLSAD